MATDLSALKAAIRLLADAANDTIKSQSASTTAGKIVEFENLIPDILRLMPMIGDIPAEVAALQPPDYQALLAELATDLSLPVGKAEQIVAASLKLLGNIAATVVPDIEALVAVIKQ